MINDIHKKSSNNNNNINRNSNNNNDNIVRSLKTENV